MEHRLAMNNIFISVLLSISCSLLSIILLANLFVGHPLPTPTEAIKLSSSLFTPIISIIGLYLTYKAVNIAYIAHGTWINKHKIEVDLKLDLEHLNQIDKAYEVIAEYFTFVGNNIMLACSSEVDISLIELTWEEHNQKTSTLIQIVAIIKKDNNKRWYEYSEIILKQHQEIFEICNEICCCMAHSWRYAKNKSRYDDDITMRQKYYWTELGMHNQANKDIEKAISDLKILISNRFNNI